MKLIEKTTLKDSVILTPEVHSDERGFFFESWNLLNFQKLGFDYVFVQDNHSRSKKGVLRGLHYQLKNPQGKLVRVSSGSVLDVIVDLRKSSPTFGNYFSIELNSENNKQLWIPPGMAHGFYALSDDVDLTYKVTCEYFPDDEHTIIWNDKYLNIDWRCNSFEPIVSTKDRAGLNFIEAPYYD